MNLYQKFKTEKTSTPMNTNTNIRTKIKTIINQKSTLLIETPLFNQNHKNYNYSHNNSNIHKSNQHQDHHCYKYYKTNNFKLNQSKHHNKIIKQRIKNLILKFINNNKYSVRILIQIIKLHQVPFQCKKSPYVTQACGLNRLLSAMISS